MQLNRILVPTDFSDTANHAEAQAIALAKRPTRRFSLSMQWSRTANHPRT
jgi:hypothetical protein